MERPPITFPSSLMTMIWPLPMLFGAMITSRTLFANFKFIKPWDGKFLILLTFLSFMGQMGQSFLNVTELSALRLIGIGDTFPKLYEITCSVLDGAMETMRLFRQKKPLNGSI